jgi:hypothetical protein
MQSQKVNLKSEINHIHQDLLLGSLIDFESLILIYKVIHDSVTIISFNDNYM